MLQATLCRVLVALGRHGKWVLPLGLVAAILLPRFATHMQVAIAPLLALLLVSFLQLDGAKDTSRLASVGPVLPYQQAPINLFYCLLPAISFRCISHPCWAITCTSDKHNMQADKRSRFLIESCDVRGQFVHLDSCWAAATARTDYPATVSTVLGQAFAATALLAGTIKFDGKLTLQVRGSGDVHLLVVQITHDGNLRGLARWKNEPATTVPADVFGDDARMTITIEAEQTAEPYQGIVPLEGESLAEAIEHYFRVSEQLHTQVHLAVSDTMVAGLLIQALPPAEQQTNDTDGWARATALADTLSEQELLQEDVHTLLHRLYHEERVRLFDSDPLAFSCSCTKARTDNMLIGLGEAEVLDIVYEQGEVSITCEFCDAQYHYDAVDIAALFKGYVGDIDASSTQH